MFKFLSRFRKAYGHGSNHIEESASLGDDPYLAQITSMLGCGDAATEGASHATVKSTGGDEPGDEAYR